MGQFGSVWISLGQCGSVRLGVYGLITLGVGQYCSVWVSVDQCGLVWVSVDQNGSVWVGVYCLLWLDVVQ